MCKVRSYVSHCITKAGLWLAVRLGVVDKVVGSSPDFLRDYLSSKIRQASDVDLDRMITDCEEGSFKNEYVARVYRTLQEGGIDVLQELKNEKFLRDHRKKYGKVSR